MNGLDLDAPAGEVLMHCVQGKVPPRGQKAFRAAQNGRGGKLRGYSVNGLDQDAPAGEVPKHRARGQVPHRGQKAFRAA